MAGDALMQEFNQPVTTTGTQEHLDRLAALNAEISRRMVEHAKLLADAEKHRQQVVPTMVAEMTTKMYEVWKKYGGRILADSEIDRLSKAMFEFFVTIRPK